MAKKKVEKVEVETTEVQNVEAVQEKPFMPLTFEEIVEKIAVKSKSTILEKEAIVQLVENNCIVKDETNGVFYVDELMQVVSASLGLLNYYTNFNEVIENAGSYTYDYLYECGLFDYIESQMDKKDYKMLDDALYSIYDKVRNLNSLGSCLYRIVDKTIKELPNMKDVNKMIKGLPKILNNIDKDTLSVFAKELGNGTIANQVINKDNIVDITDGTK
jgi:hypothetical protein